MKQVFMNLVMNAKQAIADGGTIWIITEAEPRTEQIKITVSDNGCGVPEAMVDKIFDPFFTTKPVGEGTGLGLAVSYGIIHEHDGSIEVKSEEGVGTTFTIHLPQRGLEGSLTATVAAGTAPMR
jgi:signal transduction histidine kinase